MDDPWGSPWADESPRPLPKLDKLVPKRPVTPEKSLGVNEESKSPWDNNDAFGEWAALPESDELQANVQEGPEQAESVEWNASVNEEFSQGKDHIRPDGSAWFRRAIPPDGEIHGLETPKVTGRAFSPDPWAQEAAEEAPRPSQFAELKADEESAKYDTNEDGCREEIENIGNEDEYITKAIGELDKSVPPSIVEETSIEKPSINRVQDRPTVVMDDVATDMQAEEVTQGESLASRPSSSPSDHSHHDEILTESPRTSFEEEDKRPKLEIEGSSKVKEMVRLFDGLAVDASSIELPRHPEGVDAPDDHFDTPVAAQSEEDFGDFEEGISYVTTKADPTEDALIKPEEIPLDKAGVHDVPVLSTSTEEPVISPSEQPLQPHDPVHFKPDLSLLRDIFGQGPDVEFQHADPKQAPEIDTVMKDSFSSTDERKTWYRISRYSTMRKHNAGDEDSYVRINWKDSTVRAETLKIVERWIEEDRIGGGIILGGGTKLGSMFGWGQKNAGPMSVTAALASTSKKAAMHSDRIASPTSIRSSGDSPGPGSSSNRRSLEQMSASRNSFHSPISVTAPQFSWSTGTPISATAEVKLPVLPSTKPANSSGRRFDISPSSPEVIKESSSKKAPPPAGPLVISTLPPGQHLKPAASGAPKLGQDSGSQKVLAIPALPANEPRSEAEDEWGEMVSSPALLSPPPLDRAFEVQSNLGVMEVLSPRLATNPPAPDLDHQPGRRSNKGVMPPQSEVGKFVPSSFANHAAKLETSSPAAPTLDAWATVDFSFFDSPAPSKPAPALPALIPKATIPPPLPAKKNQGSSRERAEQDRIVKSIVQNLPDLSYMLRR
jgi:hypothetical protein